MQIMHFQNSFLTCHYVIFEIKNIIIMEDRSKKYFDEFALFPLCILSYYFTDPLPLNYFDIFITVMKTS